MKIKLGIIFGGESVEHEVSIISALQAMENINTEKYEIVPIYIAKDNEWYTSESLRDVSLYKNPEAIKEKCKNVVLYKKDDLFVLQAKKGLFKTIVNTIDVAFPIVHGTNVEDGVLSGYLESIGIPHVASDVYASVVGQDKIYMKMIFQSLGLPIVNFDWFYDSDYLEDSTTIIKRLKKMSFPLIVKPATLGSSVGIKIAHNEEELESAITDAINYDSRILVEEVVNNLSEVNISVLGNYQNHQVSAIEQINCDDDLLTYEDKYIGGGKTKNACSKGMLSASRTIPAPLKANLRKEIEDIAKKAFKGLKSSGVVRIDFLIDTKTNQPYINEINSIPGSLAFYLWEATDKKYSELIDDLVSIALKEYKNKVAKTHSFTTNILNGFSSNGLKGLKGNFKNK